jgi:hypothetical protein
MYKVIAIKNGESVVVKRIAIEEDGTILAIYYRNIVGKITWDFPEDFDKFEITEEKP